MSAFFELMGRLGLNATSYEVGLKRVQSETRKIGKEIESELKSKIAAAFGAAAIEEGARRSIEYAGKIKKLSEQFEVSTDRVQEWDFALKATGSSIEVMAGFMDHLAEARQKALEGDPAAEEAFLKFGLARAELVKSRLEDVAQAVARVIKTGDPQALIPTLREIGGRGASDLIATFRAGLDELGSGVRAAGLLMEKEIIDRLDVIGSKFEALGKKSIITFGPAVAWLGNFLANGADFAGNYILGGKKAYAEAFMEKAEGNWLTRAGHLIGSGIPFLNQTQDLEAQAAGERARNKHNEEIENRWVREARGPNFKEKFQTNLDDIENKRLVALASEHDKKRKELEDLTFKNDLANLSSEKQLQALAKKRSEIVDSVGPKTQDQLIEAEKLRGQIDDIKRGSALDVRPQANELQRIGAFNGDPSAIGIVLVDVGRQLIQANRDLIRTIEDKPTQGGWSEPSDPNLNYG